MCREIGHRAYQNDGDADTPKDRTEAEKKLNDMNKWKHVTIPFRYTF